MPSSAMEPTIEKGRLVLGEPLEAREKTSIARGDVVLFTVPFDKDNVHLRRVIAIGGDVVSLRDQHLYINDEAVRAEYGRHPAIRGHSGAQQLLELNPRGHFYGPFTVPSEHVFVLGDNWEESVDSRVFGPVHVSAIVSRR